MSVSVSKMCVVNFKLVIGPELYVHRKSVNGPKAMVQAGHVTKMIC